MGLNPEKVVDEFNGFLFEHTSKISLDDIRAAQKKLEEKEKKKKSPYTIQYKKKISVLPIICGILAFILFVLIIYLIISNANKAPTRVDELKSYNERECIYEFTY